VISGGGRVVSVSMAIVALTAPVLGSIADRSGIRRALFMGFTALSVTATALMATVHPGMVVWGFDLAVLGNVRFGAPVYYNAWLQQLAPRGQQGRLSALGAPRPTSRRVNEVLGCGASHHGGVDGGCELQRCGGSIE
jgi:MFS-type transporter involved in bile tolerance (Atg22 family)